jgi:hypothetical protein
MTGYKRKTWKRIIQTLILIGTLLIATFSNVRADFESGHGAVLEPNTPYLIQLQWSGNHIVILRTHLFVNKITYADGFVQTLNSSDGSSFTLGFSMDERTVFLTQYDQDTQPICQWISHAD